MDSDMSEGLSNPGLRARVPVVLTVSLCGLSPLAGAIPARYPTPRQDMGGETIDIQHVTKEAPILSGAKF